VTHGEKRKRKEFVLSKVSLQIKKRIRKTQKSIGKKNRRVGHGGSRCTEDKVREKGRQ
jgi:hypothetical protein